MTIDRLFISHQYIRGKGIEIGAWHNPFPVNPQMQVTYVDRYPYEELIKMRDNDPAIQGKAISRVDVVDDGMWLEKFEDGLQDFVLSSHQLEHCWNPLATIENHLRVLKPGGRIFYAVPDMRFTFDKERNRSQCAYDVIDIYNDDAMTEEILEKQYTDYLINVDHKSDDEIDDILAKDPILTALDIHWFTWDANDLADTMAYAGFQFKAEIELFSRAGHENFVVLRKL